MKLCLAHIKVCINFSFTNRDFVVLEMKKMVKDILEEVNQIEKDNNVNEEVYVKLEQKVRKKFTEEVERLDKSFQRIIE